MISLVVGLGNPGLEYEYTRHNIGFMAMDNFSFDSKLNWTRKFKGLYASVNLHGAKVHFLKPQTFMNLSGESISQCAGFFKIPAEEILVVHDELDIPFGTLILKKGGGLAGHNGLKSTAKCLGTQDFLRLRLGIDRPTRGSVSSYVLSAYSKDQEEFLGPFLELSAEAIEASLKDGFAKASNQYSKKKV